MRDLKSRTLAGLLCVGLTLPVIAEDAAVETPAAGTSTVPAAIDACSRLRRDSERLACYDRAVADLKAGKASETAPPAENMFGASAGMAAPEAAERENREDEIRQITAKVISLRKMDDGGLLLTLDNDQVWRQQDSDFRLTVEIGDSVTIRRASLGTFRITDTRGRSARFRRVR